MYREDYKVTVPQFKRLEVLLSDCGAISGKLDIETGRHNARVINDKVKELSASGWDCDIKSLTDQTGFTPSYNLQQGLKKTLTDFQSNKT